MLFCLPQDIRPWIPQQEGSKAGMGQPAPPTPQHYPITVLLSSPPVGLGGHQQLWLPSISWTRSLGRTPGDGSVSSIKESCSAIGEGEGLLAWSSRERRRKDPNTKSCLGFALVVISAGHGRRARLGGRGSQAEEGGSEGGTSPLEQMTRRFLFAFCCFGEGLAACSSSTAVRKGSGLLARLLLEVWDRMGRRWAGKTSLGAQRWDGQSPGFQHKPTLWSKGKCLITRLELFRKGKRK